MSLRNKKGSISDSGNSEEPSEFGARGFSSRLLALIGEGSVNAFAKDCEIGETSLRQYLRGGVPGLDKVVRIARAKKVRVEWLATGEGPRDLQPDLAISPVRTNGEREGGSVVLSGHGEVSDQDIVLLPRLSLLASAGQGIVPTTEDVEEFLAFKVDFLRHLGVNPRNAHILQIKGGSMYPTFRDGDVIVIDASLIEVLEEGFYTIVYGGAVFAKRIQPLRDDSLRIVSDNKADGYVDEIVPAEERHTLKIVGRIRGVYRNL